MAGQIEVAPGVSLQPSGKQVATAKNYISDFDYLRTEMPELYKDEFGRYGNRSVSGWLARNSAEIPFASDQVKWTEEGRLHIKYTQVTSSATASSNTAVLTVADTITSGLALREGQGIVVVSAAGENKALITDVDPQAKTVDVAYYSSGGQLFGTGDTVELFIYGSEFAKGANGMKGSIESETEIFENSPVILKDHYEVSGSDMAQIGWVEVDDGEGNEGYCWYLKSKADTRTKFSDYLETNGLEAEPAEVGSGVASHSNDQLGNKGSEGVFYVINKRGNLWTGGFPDSLPEWDEVAARLDNQGAIAENMLFLNRQFDSGIDDMLATLNGYNGTGAANAASFGAFNNSSEMALNLGFTGFHRAGYDFYKSTWKYLISPTMRGNLAATATGNVQGLLVPAGTKSVHDQMMGEKVKRPFLHTRYRMKKHENRKLKSWVIGSAGGENNTDKDSMSVHWLSERCTCTLGSVNFFKFNK